MKKKAKEEKKSGLLVKWAVSLRVSRERLRLTNRKFAAASGVNKTDLCLIECARKFPTPQMAGRIASFLKRELEEVFPRYWAEHGKLIAQRVENGQRIRSF